MKDEDARKKLHKLIEKEDWEQLVMLSKELWENAGDKEKDKLKEVYDYYSNNRKALDRYWTRIPREILDKVPGGLIRGMGTMESSIHNTLGDRMKGSAWSIDGADAVAKALCIKHSSEGDYAMGQIIYGRDIDLVRKGIIANMLTQKIEEAKKDVNSAVRDSIRETKKKRAFSGANSHIAVFDSKVTQLRNTLRGLIGNTAQVI